MLFETFNTSVSLISFQMLQGYTHIVRHVHIKEPLELFKDKIMWQRAKAVSEYIIKGFETLVLQVCSRILRVYLTYSTYLMRVQFRIQSRKINFYPIECGKLSLVWETGTLTVDFEHFWVVSKGILTTFLYYSLAWYVSHELYVRFETGF